MLILMKKQIAYFFNFPGFFPRVYPILIKIVKNIKWKIGEKKKPTEISILKLVLRDMFLVFPVFFVSSSI